MLVDMLEEVYKDIESEKAASAPPTDPAADEMTKALAESNKKIEELKTKFDKLASAGSSIKPEPNPEPNPEPDPEPNPEPNPDPAQ